MPFYIQLAGEQIAVNAVSELDPRTRPPAP